MALDLNKLENHVTANSQEFVYRALSEADAVKFVQSYGGFRVNIKNEEQINLLDTTAKLRKSNGCGRNPDNTTTLGTVNLKVHQLQSDENICIDELNSKFTNQFLQSGSDYTDLYFADELMNLKAEKIALANDFLIFKGDTGSTDPDLIHFDGWLKALNAETKAVVLPTADRLYKRLQLALALVPNAVKRQKDFVIQMSKDDFETIQIEVANDNYYKESEVAKLLGTNKVMVAQEGLEDEDLFIMGKAESFIIGTDLESEFSEGKFYKSIETGNMYLDYKYKIGAVVVNPEDIYIFKKA
ncbi:hypothetical protein GEO21_21665 [Sphingobacterium faecium]|uniref:hypothetical protein n=1 Tax=Sphingobacterium faecium TaxID=34087 RepID=UPI0012910A74|nr:hypothetical protein [Sphingobacterium faecium]MQP30094.1 hypothetical protein [Sphingobacterium faecium]